MDKGLLRTLAYIGFLAAGIALTVVVFSGTDLGGIMDRIVSADAGYVALAVTASVAGHLSRAARWRLLLEGAGTEAGLRDVLIALMTGYFVNTGVPRLGEATRCGVLYRLGRIPVAKAAGTVVAERTVDLLTLAVMLALAWWTGGAEMRAFLAENVWSPARALLSGGRLPVVIAAIAVAGLVAWWLARRSAKRGLWRNAAAFVRAGLEGLLGVFRLRKPLTFLLHTLVIWGSYFLAPLFTLLALGYRPDNLVGLSFAVFTVGAVARTLPVPAGSMGAYHWLVSRLLLTAGFSEAGGLAVATMNHAVQTLFYLVAGAAAFGAYFYLERRLLRREREAA